MEPDSNYRPISVLGFPIASTHETDTRSWNIRGCNTPRPKPQQLAYLTSTTIINIYTAHRPYLPPAQYTQPKPLIPTRVTCTENTQNERWASCIPYPAARAGYQGHIYHAHAHHETTQWRKQTRTPYAVHSPLGYLLVTRLTPGISPRTERKTLNGP